MHSIIKRVVTTAAAAGAAIGLGVGPAAATATITVTGGPSYAGVASNVVLTAGVATVSCSGSTISGIVLPGSYVLPAQIGAVTSSTWTSCTPGTGPASVTGTGSWQVWATGPQSGGMTPVELHGVDITVSIPSTGCVLHFTGTESGTWDNPTQVLSLPGSPATLSVAASGFCPGYASPGSLTATYHVTGSPSPVIVT